MGQVVPLFSESVPDFIRREGRGRAVPTVNIGSRFGWDAREAYGRLRDLERRGLVRRAGVSRMDVGAVQSWLAVPA